MITSDLIVLRRFVMLGVIALSVIVLAGCGSSSSPTQTTATGNTTAPADTGTATTTTAATMTREEFVAKLDDICKRGNDSVASLQAEYTKAANANDYTKAASLLEEANRKNEPYIAEFEQLTPPASLQAPFDRYATATRRLNGLRARIATALRARDLSTLSQLSDLATSEQKKRTEAALDLGTTHCGQ